MSSFQPKDGFKAMLRRMSELTLDDRPRSKKRLSQSWMYKLSEEESLEQHSKSIARIDMLRKELLDALILLDRAEMDELPSEEQCRDTVTRLTTQVNKEWGVIYHLCSPRPAPIRPFYPQATMNGHVQDESLATTTFNPRVKLEPSSSSVISYEPSDPPSLLHVNALRNGMSKRDQYVRTQCTPQAEFSFL